MTTSNSHKNISAHNYGSVNNYRSYLNLLLDNHQFRRLWIASIISQLGNWFNYIAIFVLLNQFTGSGHAVSWFLIAKYIPTTFLGPTAGIVADRISRKTIMVFCDTARIFVVLGYLFVDGADMVWLVYLLALVQESIWTFYDPARRASVPNVCREGELHIANALSGATWSIMLAAGAALGGIATTLWGWQTAILLDSITFFLSALILRKLILPPANTTQKKDFSFRDYLGIDDIIAGWRYIKKNRKITSILVVKSGWAFSGGILVMLTIFGEQVLTEGSNGGGSGILYSCRGVGAAIGPLLAWRLLGESDQAMHKAIAIAFFIAGFSYMLLSMAPNFYWAGPLVMIGHIGGSIQWVFSTTLIQKMVPDTFRGRVLATEMVLFTFILSLSTYFTGSAIDTGVAPREVMFYLGALFLVPGIMWSGYIYFFYKDFKNK
ncbi:MAG: MFS transporter [Desulfobulbaceae bacterium]|nr:MFS transporter [Desulfobulbaceae bacterium]